MCGVLGVFFFRVCVCVCVCVVLQWLVLFRFVRERGRRLNHFASLALLMLYRGSAAAFVVERRRRNFRFVCVLSDCVEPVRPGDWASVSAGLVVYT